MRSICAGLVFAAALFAADAPAPITQTDHLDFPAGGTLKMVNSSGEVLIEAWDQPGIEITTIKSVKSGSNAREFDQVKVTAERKGDAVVITTVLPRHPKWLRLFEGETDFDIDYHIRLPRTARLDIAHDMGEVHIDGVTGEIHATVNMGLLTVQVPENGQYAIDAKSKVGSVDSDFMGKDKRDRLLGHDFSGGSGSQKLYLRIGYGDVMLMALHTPVLPQT